MVATVILVYVFLTPVILFILFFAIRAHILGKLLVFFIDKDKTLKYYLFVPGGKIFRFKKDGESYTIDPRCIVLIRYPFGLPSFMQQVVPCLVYAKNNPQPLSPEDISKVPTGLTAKMVESTVSENVIGGIVKSVSEGSKKELFPSWLLPGISILLILVMAVMIYTMNAKMEQVMGYINALRP